MGLVTLPGTQIQYFSFSEEAQVFVAKVFAFIFNLAPGWFLLIFVLSVGFIVLGIFLRLKRGLAQTGG